MKLIEFPVNRHDMDAKLHASLPASHIAWWNNFAGVNFNEAVHVGKRIWIWFVTNNIDSHFIEWDISSRVLGLRSRDWKSSSILRNLWHKSITELLSRKTETNPLLNTGVFLEFASIIQQKPLNHALSPLWITQTHLLRNDALFFKKWHWFLKYKHRKHTSS